MAEQFLANNVVFQVKDPDALATWYTLVCETDLTGSLTAAVNTIATKCGPKKSIGLPGLTFSGSGIANPDATASQASLKQVTDWCNSNELLYGRMVNLAADTVALGEAILLRGEGYFTSAVARAAADGVLEFDWTFEIIDTPDTEESDES